jgi:hypothetical protein
MPKAVKSNILIVYSTARIVNVFDCTPDEICNFFSLDNTQAPNIVFNISRLHDIDSHLYRFSDPFFSFIMSPMLQTLQTLQTGCLLSWLHPVINIENCTPSCFLTQSCFRRDCLCLDGHLCQRSRAKESKGAWNTQLTNHSPSVTLVMAAQGLTNNNRMRLKWVASGSRYLLELLLLPRSTEL